MSEGTAQGAPRARGSSRGRGRGGAGGRQAAFGGSLTTFDASVTDGQTNGAESNAATTSAGDGQPPTGPRQNRGSVKPNGPVASSRGTGKRGRGRGGGARAERSAEGSSAVSAQRPAVLTGAEGHKAALAAAAAAAAAAEAAAEATAGGEVVDLCHICAEPVQLYSLAACNHRTCHICAIRLRALYKKKDCTFCKTPIERLIFTSSPDRPFESFLRDDLPFYDQKLSIAFETREAMEETLILLRFNCPEPTCEEACNGWGDLKRHVRRDHDMGLCDMCIKNKRIFAHEHSLHTNASLTAHIDAEHRYCEFCREHFYGDDELFVHMRDRHEQCHLCKARGTEEERYRYYKDYNMLEKHFKDKHFLCESSECLAKKFIVFDSDMDFKAHRLAEHSADLSSRERRDAARIETNFAYEDPATSRAGRSRRGGRGEDPIVAAEQPTTSYLAGRTHVPGAAPPNRREAFGGSLTGASTNGATSAASHRVEHDTGLASSGDASTVERHQVYLARVASLLKDSESRVAAFRQSVKAFRSGETSGRDLADSIYRLADNDLETGSSLVNGLVDLLDDTDKRRSLQSAWNSVRIERTQFPSLTPQAADGRYAGIAGGQIRNAKASSSAHSHIWANVERAASSSSGHGAGRPVALRESFPTLKPGGGGSVVPGSAKHAALKQSNLRASGSSTPWAGSGTSTPVASNSGTNTPALKPFTVHAPAQGSKSGGAHGGAALRSNASAFPGLPSNADAAALQAQKKALFAYSKDKGKGKGSQGGAGPNYNGANSGTSTPKPWGSAQSPDPHGRIDGYASPEVPPIDAVPPSALHQRLAQASGAQSSAGGGGGKKKAKKLVLDSFGGVHRGG
ncbi:hypothetical protein IE81DRAFT_37576 [Ceraceosorus guamensis]|uniref:RING-type E3 ubiquitin transferase n=1 Tax=Ceraceosorus guamensis TaxID=1522189 RepID=A0A316W2S7_9BASI|nr:hypothetical protein IE81DRAFT_37576 [Ceraceosorus guamensis]PWN44197.1 hypothetical protein IE81DRAFT_37576 [Ceraceosorus guamensis]